jgi:O-antigen/teichoic acid export membrane protein
VNITDALKWSFLSELAAKIVQPVVFIVLARLLTPEDFGVVAAAMMVISFSQIFWEAGMGKAVIQSQSDQTAVANTAFWINNALGFVVAGILIAISDPIADHVFHDPRVGLVLRVMSAQVFLAALGAVHTALLQKEMQFKSLFWVRFATVSFPGLVSIPLAVQGMGYWAIVVGTLVGQVVQVIVLWKISSWRPALRIDQDVGKKLIGFGVWVAFSGLLAWFYGWADSLIVGIYLGAKDLGVYRTGSQFVAMIYAVIFGPVLPVLYSFLSDIQDDLKRSEKAFVKVVTIVTFLSIPLAFILHILSAELSSIVFGEKWSGVGSIVSVLAISTGFSWIIYPNLEYYRGRGKPEIETKVMVFTVPVYLVAYAVSASVGLTEFLWTRLGLVLLGVLVHWRFLTSNSFIKIASLTKPLLNYLPAPLFITICASLISTKLQGDIIAKTSLSISAVILIFISTAFVGRNSELRILLNYISKKKK